MPEYITPIHYNVTLFVDLKNFKFNGHVSILFDVKELSEYVLVHINKLVVTSVAVHQSSRGEYCFYKIDSMVVYNDSLLCTLDINGTNNSAYNHLI